MDSDANSRHRQFQNPHAPLSTGKSLGSFRDCHYAGPTDPTAPIDPSGRRLLKMAHRGKACSLAMILIFVLTSAFVRPFTWKGNDSSCSRYIAVASQVLPARENGRRVPVRAFCEDDDPSLTRTSLAARFSLGMMRVLQMPIPINKLDRDDWESLSGIGPKLAEKIIETRYHQGGFRSLDDLSAVPGIGPARMMVLQAAINGVNTCSPGHVACQ